MQMKDSEFSLIERYFVNGNLSRKDVDLGIGDDCALLSIPQGYQVAITTDTLVAGTHFLLDADPVRVGFKALASNLSDLAAMGAKPAWVSLALTLPETSHKWLEGFCEGFFQLLKQYDIQLIGGDTTKGPLSITITAQGLVPKGEAMTRKGAKIGDDIYVTGFLGDSAAGLEVLLNKSAQTKTELEIELERRHYYSTPKIELAQQIRQLCHSAVDISDGLIADLAHILKQSNVSAQIQVDTLPLSDELLAYYHHDIELCQKKSLMSGEEYELCFTAPKKNREAIKQLSFFLQHNISIIGEIVDKSLSNQQYNISLNRSDTTLDWVIYGYDHFRSEL